MFFYLFFIIQKNYMIHIIWWNMMDNETIDVNIVSDWNIEEIVHLYKSAGWWKDTYDASKLPQLIKGSFVFAVAIDKKTNTAVGMGRVISDGISDGYIQDVVVLPSYRKKGIGKVIVNELINFCLSKGVEWIALISEPDQSPFYLPLGFKEMLRYTPMKYEP